MLTGSHEGSALTGCSGKPRVIISSSRRVSLLHSLVNHPLLTSCLACSQTCMMVKEVEAALYLIRVQHCERDTPHSLEQLHLLGYWDRLTRMSLREASALVSWLLQLPGARVSDLGQPVWLMIPKH